MRFRFGEFAVVGDIEQMFHQVKVTETERDVLRFVWRESPDQDISDCQMSTHFFGKINSHLLCELCFKEKYGR